MMTMVRAAANAIENDLFLARSNEIIRRQDAEKQSIIDNINDGVVYVDENDVIVQVNKKIIQMTEQKREYFIGRKIRELKTDPPLKLIEKELDVTPGGAQLKLQGRKHVYDCYVIKEKVETDAEGVYNSLWIFTEAADIQDMADKMNMENRAVFTFDSIKGKSKKMMAAIGLAKRAAAYETRTIIEGESGTGKEMIAQAIHNTGPRRKGPFVAVDCGAIPKELLESELFGYDEGAYTGARRGGQRGKFELANKGTLFLDEIGNMPLNMQIKLLRVLQENKVTRLGSNKTIAINVQVIVATNMDLEEAIEKGAFREDLYYRLNIIKIKLPPLRERRDDIPVLVDNYIRQHKKTMGKITGISEDAVDALKAYDWPGNVRQLHNVLERMIVLSDQRILTKNLIPREVIEKKKERNGDGLYFGDIEPLTDMTEKYVRYAIDSCNGNIKKSAEKLNISRATVYRIIGKNGGR